MQEWVERINVTKTMLTSKISGILFGGKTLFPRGFSNTFGNGNEFI